ncbi:Lipoyltransferase and lipoate-protein ligase [Mycena venus]|uniref:Putative lipoate-protein ligase A n=1 Tax=Mycena venus TaxID=2733690 RepID=A0A8H6Y428_9AGAR|nr:Lipoyltransferase and lipoate-protein ligase [Mycena venus]
MSVEQLLAEADPLDIMGSILDDELRSMWMTAPTDIVNFHHWDAYIENRNITIDRSVFISESTDPLFNLTFEDWLFRHSPPDKPVLFLYRNTPCVVIGRNQNPWKEVNMQALRSRNVPLVRRRSGGGTVYHDLGNTNFSIHLARRAFDRRVTSQLVLRAVLSLGVERARLNDRNDICVGDDKMNALGDLLRVEKPTMITKGVASVRSPVCNLQQTSPHIGHDVFVNAVVDEFQREYGLDKADNRTQYVDDSARTLLSLDDDGSGRTLEYVDNGVAELKSWDWLYGQTPEFAYSIEQGFPWGSVTAELRAKHGIILSCALQAPNAPSHVVRALEQLGASAEGERYGSWPPLRQQDDRAEVGPKVCEVTRWLAGKLN